MSLSVIFWLGILFVQTLSALKMAKSGPKKAPLLSPKREKKGSPKKACLRAPRFTKCQKNSILRYKTRLLGVIDAIKRYKKRAITRRPTLKSLAEQLQIKESTLRYLLSKKSLESHSGLKRSDDFEIHTKLVSTGLSARRVAKQTGTSPRTAQRHTKLVRQDQKKRKQNERKKWMVRPSEHALYSPSCSQMHSMNRSANLYR